MDLLTSPATIGLSYYREQVALFVAMTLAGTPVWLLPWRAMQRLAIAQTEDSINERRSTVRKTYLYFFVFIASIAIFGSAGWFVFHILTALLGADLPDDFITLVLNALVIAVLAVGVWLYHWLAIRRDGQLEQQEQNQRLADILIVVIDGEEGKLGQSIIRHLRQELPGIQLKPIGVTGQAAKTMAGQPFSATTIEMAHYIIGSWQTLNATSIAPVITAASATKFAVPLSNQNWIWTGIASHSTEYYARQAVQGIKQAIDGEDINFGREMDTGTIVAIVVGVLLFLFIGGSLIGGFITFFGL
jgi:hypothetical protein